MKDIGMEGLYSLKKKVYPRLVWEFYSTLYYNNPVNPLEGETFFCGRKFLLKYKSVLMLLNFKPLPGMYQAYDTVVSAPGFTKQKALEMFTKQEVDKADPTMLI